MSDQMTTKAFVQSKAFRGYFVYVCFCGLLSVAVGCGLYYMSLNWFKQTKSEETITALQLVDAFVADYSDDRGKFLSGDAPVPATFRAHAIERFNRTREAARTLRLVMVGPPGREIAIAPLDADMAQSIERFSAEPAPKPETGFVTLNGDVVFRTAYPSLASQQSCVDCHNKLQAGKQQWKLNDVLGAFVVDVPAGPFLHSSRMQAAGLGLGIFVLLAAIGFYISLLHFRQLTEREVAQRRIELKRGAVPRLRRNRLRLVLGAGREFALQLSLQRGVRQIRAAGRRPYRQDPPRGRQSWRHRGAVAGARSRSRGAPAVR